MKWKVQPGVWHCAPSLSMRLLMRWLHRENRTLQNSNSELLGSQYAALVFCSGRMKAIGFIITVSFINMACWVQLSECARGIYLLLSDHFYYYVIPMSFSFSKWFLSLSSLSLLLCFHQCTLCSRSKAISEDCSWRQITRPIPSPESRPQQPVQPGPGMQLRNNIIALLCKSCFFVPSTYYTMMIFFWYF